MGVRLAAPLAASAQQRGRKHCIGLGFHQGSMLIILMRADRVIE